MWRMVPYFLHADIVVTLCTNSCIYLLPRNYDKSAYITLYYRKPKITQCPEQSLYPSTTIVWQFVYSFVFAMKHIIKITQALQARRN